MSDRRELLVVRDADARQQAQTDFEHPLIVIAGAGTGKTALLVARIVAWVLGQGWDRNVGAGVDDGAVARRVVERVAAITFTDAAAAEMAQRVTEALGSIAFGDGAWPVGWLVENPTLPGTEEMRRRSRLLSDEVHRLRVQTIHSFCHALLATHPFEAGLHSRFEVDAEGTRVDTVIDEVVETELRHLSGIPSREWNDLALRGISPHQVAEASRVLVHAGIRSEDLENDPFTAEIAQARATELRDSLDVFLETGGRDLTECSRQASKTIATAEALVQVQEIMEHAPELVEFGFLSAVATEIGAEVVKKVKEWSAGTFNKSEMKVLQERERPLAGAAARLFHCLDGMAFLDPVGQRAARALLSSILRDAQKTLRARGVVTYGDLLCGADRLLTSSQQLCERLSRDIDQFLVDEFQDTDDIQCRIVEKLALNPDGSRNPGLLVVGDPKQSIYGFRRADLAAFDAFSDRLVAAGGEKLYLSRNFRSVQPVLDEVERVIEPIMTEEWGIQPAFQPLETARTEQTSTAGKDLGSRAEVEHWVAWPLDDAGVPQPLGQSQSMTFESEARALATDIRTLSEEQGVRWGDIAVLMRTTTQQEVILENLRRAGVPYEVAREREYYRQREVVEAVALIRCVLEPCDSLALLTVLRSDVVGVPDIALAPLWDAGLPKAMSIINEPTSDAMEAVLAAVNDGALKVGEGGSGELPLWVESVRNALEIIAELRRSFDRDPPDRWIEKLRVLWLPEVTAASRYLGRFRVARLERLFEQLERTLVETGPGRAGIARALRRSVEEGRDSRLPPESDTNTDAVQVLTIHRAKGLGFGHVYVVQTHRHAKGQSRRQVAEVLRRKDGLETTLFGFQTPGFAAAQREKERRERAETVRLLYVAMTRAKERIVISGGWKKVGGFVSPEDAKSLGELVAHRGDNERLQTMCVEGVASLVDENTGVRWYFPALIEAAGTWLEEQHSSRDVDAGPVRTTQDFNRLQAARQHASIRERRSTSRQASSGAHGVTTWTNANGERDADREVSMAVGTVVHAILEKLDLRGNLKEQILKPRAGGPLEGDDSLRRLTVLLERIATGTCLERLANLSSNVVARELPILVPPHESDDALGFIAGSIDLVYRDPDCGHLVVADYKTDRIEAEAEITEKCDGYLPQLETYAMALQRALDLAEKPMTELWFLDADRIVQL
ncbi:MAG: UvrD-helicase domain-containing protein [bacterium]|nr:UvrD-helicase domain-containing protein [bacterium]